MLVKLALFHGLFYRWLNGLSGCRAQGFSVSHQNCPAHRISVFKTSLFNAEKIAPHFFMSRLCCQEQRAGGLLVFDLTVNPQNSHLASSRTISVVVLILICLTGSQAQALAKSQCLLGPLATMTTTATIARISRSSELLLYFLPEDEAEITDLSPRSPASLPDDGVLGSLQAETLH